MKELKQWDLCYVSDTECIDKLIIKQNVKRIFVCVDWEDYILKSLPDNYILDVSKKIKRRYKNVQ